MEGLALPMGVKKLTDVRIDAKGCRSSLKRNRILAHITQLRLKIGQDSLTRGSLSTADTR